MQIKLFTIPIGDNGEAIDEMNRFLRAHTILEIEKEFVGNPNGACWCFCVCYLKKTVDFTGENKKKVDYKELLDEATFKKFSRLREIRKKVAADSDIPAYAVFTDEELAGLAKLEKIDKKSMLSIKGIGDKKVEKFAKYFITPPEQNETPGKSA